MGRILILTGPRQAGKTTLVKTFCPDYDYVSVEDPVLRPNYAGMSAAEWFHQYPVAIVDEVQKIPHLVETVKAVYDEHEKSRYILLGSSQLLLLKKIRESLAGRAGLLELFPMTLPECQTSDWNDDVRPSWFIRQIERLMKGESIDEELPMFTEKRLQMARHWWKHFMRYGSMPSLLDATLTEQERDIWLSEYRRTYLERDLDDIARINDLEPFVLAQQAAAHLTGECVNYQQVAGHAGIAPRTARRFLSYLDISYQVIFLRPWFRNTGKRLVKSPKLHFLDTGIWRAITRSYGECDGHVFESAVVSEIYKQVRNCQLPAQLWFLRTFDGREVDLLIELEQGYIAVEIKKSRRVDTSDARHFKGVAEMLDKPLLFSCVLSNDSHSRRLSQETVALPVAAALG